MNPFGGNLCHENTCATLDELPRNVTRIIICITRILEFIAVIERLAVAAEVVLVDGWIKETPITDRLCACVFVRRNGVVNLQCTV